MNHHNKKIYPRDLQFDFCNAARPWLNNDIYLTHMFNTPSIVLPYVEGLVNFSVKNLLHTVQDKDLHEHCLNFVKQETFHSREHVKYNKVLLKNGFTFDKVIQQIRRKLQYVKYKWSPLSILAIGVGFECFTSIISITVLENNSLDKADDILKHFWLWHMMEELEHKSVLMDLYHQSGGGYFRRITIFTLVLISYCYYGWKIYSTFLKLENLSLINGLSYATRKSSFFRKSLLGALKCYRYRYHPNKIKTDHLIKF